MFKKIARKITLWYLGRVYADAIKIQDPSPEEQVWIKDTLYYVSTTITMISDGSKYSQDILATRRQLLDTILRGR